MGKKKENSVIFKFSKAALFKKIFESVVELVRETNIECNSSGILISSLDTSHVSFIHLTVGKETFTEYVCENTVKIGINSETISKVLKIADVNDSLCISVDKEKDVMEIRLHNEGIFLLCFFFLIKISSSIRNTKETTLRNKAFGIGGPIIIHTTTGIQVYFINEVIYISKRLQNTLRSRRLCYIRYWF